jgi:hypothetical protein
MAINLYNPLGEFHGKLGGLLFQTGKNAQQTIRRNFRPRKTISNQDLLNRNIFRSIAGAWQSLDGSFQTLWNNFAYEAYRPLHNFRPLMYSGWNAYAGLHHVQHGLNNKINFPVISPSPYTGDVNGTNDTYEPYKSPPDYNIEPAVYNSESGECPIQFVDDGCTFSEDGDFYFDFIFNGMGLTGYTSTDIVDVNGNALSFYVYMSDCVAQKNMIPNNIFNNVCVATGRFAMAGDGFIGAIGLTISGNCSVNLNNLRYGVRNGQWFLFTLVAVGVAGSVAICDSEFIVCSEPS